MPTCPSTATSATANSVQDWLSTSLSNEQGAGVGTSWNEYAFWVAIILAFFLVGYVLYTTGRTIAMALVFVAMIFMTLYYWIKWFRDTSTSKLGVPGVWPPLVSPCPDYMVETTPGSKQCYDPVGIYYPACGQNAQGASVPLFSRTSTFDMTHIGAKTVGDFCTAVNMASPVPFTWDGIKDGAHCMY
jgi:hypothetical protein